MSESAHLTVDASVTPCRILGGESKRKSSQLGWCGSTAQRCAALGPVSGYQPAVPAQHGGWFHDQQDSGDAVSANGSRQHSEHGPVGGCESGAFDLALQNQHLVT